MSKPKLRIPQRILTKRYRVAGEQYMTTVIIKDYTGAPLKGN
jgi:hypothetical protein